MKLIIDLNERNHDDISIPSSSHLKVIVDFHVHFSPGGNPERAASYHLNINGIKHKLIEDKRATLKLNHLKNHEII